MTLSVYVAITCLVFILLACLAGLSWSGYDDNWAQNGGLVLLGIGAGLRIDQILDRHNISWVNLLVYFALALFLGGTAYKAWKFRPKKKQGISQNAYSR